MKEVVIVAAKRTPSGSYLGVLKDISAIDLGTQIVNQMLDECQLEANDVDQVIFSNVFAIQPNLNIAQEIAQKTSKLAGTSAYTLNMGYGSSFKMIENAYLNIQSGLSDCIIVGGSENISQFYEIFQSNRKENNQSSRVDLIDFSYLDYAEYIGEEFQISRHDQDNYALESQIKTQVAIEEGKFDQEIIPIPAKHIRTGEDVEVVQDQHPRLGMVMSQMKEFEPYSFEKGTITQGNSASYTDGAVGLILMSKEKALSLNLNILATIKGYYTHVNLKNTINNPGVNAVIHALNDTQLTTDQIDLFEIEESFASIALSYIRELDLSLDKINVKGGAIPLGNPLGANGLRMIVSLIHEMRRDQSRLGLVAASMNEKQAACLIIER